MIHFLSYTLFRIFGFFISLLPYPILHRFGKLAGSCAYYLHTPFRKKALANLAIAYGERKSEKERKILARKSFQNLMITLLEFFRFKKSRNKISEIVTLIENTEVEALLSQKKGVVFLTAHQANWEIPFLAMTHRFPGIAIGRPIKNKRLYHWVLSVREMFGGKIVTPKSAIRQGLKALKEGKFLGIVGDQAYPESPYCYPLFGTRAWTASTPALLAYKTGSPLVVGITRRVNNHYLVTGSSPIWPNLEAPIKEEVPKMMDQAMKLLESSIAELPEQWLWVHDRWKQQGIDHVKRKYRFGFILIILPPNASDFIHLPPLFKQIYPRSFLTFFVPKGTKIPLTNCEIKEYSDQKDLYIRDYRFQLILDFYNSKRLRRHFLKLGAFKALTIKKRTANQSLADSIKQKLVKPECLTTVTF